jgi:hypothetical protein
MLDIETLDITPSAVILQIAAVKFDLATGDIGASLIHRLDAWEQITLKRSVCPDTVAWHRKLGTDLSAGKFSLTKSLRELFVFMHQTEQIWIWGMDFDRPILEHALRSLGLQAYSWHYTKTRDARTVFRTVFPEKQATKRTHDAYQDCIDSINDLREAWQHITPQ